MYIIITIILIIVFALIIGCFYFYEVAIARTKKEFLQRNPHLKNGSDKIISNEAKEWYKSREFERITISSFDGLKLQAAFLYANCKSNKLVILAHGYAGKGEMMSSYAKYYHEKLGFHVLIPDARGHGESEGDYIGFGWNERRDYLLWIDKMLRKFGNDTEIVLHGVSMGAATVLMTSGEQLPPQVKAVIADCGFTSAKDVLTYQLRQMYKLPSFPMIPLTSILTNWRAGYSFKEASALVQVKKATAPILFIHGERDTFVPLHMVYELYASANSSKELYIVEHARHGNAYETNPDEYEKQIYAFINKYMSHIAT